MLQQICLNIAEFIFFNQNCILIIYSVALSVAAPNCKKFRIFTFYYYHLRVCIGYKYYT
jgi:hypothetical protein